MVVEYISSRVSLSTALLLFFYLHLAFSCRLSNLLSDIPCCCPTANTPILSVGFVLKSIMNGERMFKNFIPYNNNVLLELMDKEQKTEFGLIFTSDETRDYVQATIIAWPDNESMVGKKAIIKKFIGLMLDDKLFVIDKKDILGVM